MLASATCTTNAPMNRPMLQCTQQVTWSTYELPVCQAVQRVHHCHVPGDTVSLASLVAHAACCRAYTFQTQLNCLQNATSLGAALCIPSLHI